MWLNIKPLVEMLRNFFEGLGDFLEWTFQILPILADFGMNIVFMVIISIALIYWLAEMVKHQKAGEK